MEMLAHLREVIAAGSTTTIIYHGGSAPGAARAVAPISIERGTLVARDLETNKRKTYLLAKVEVVTDQAITPYRDAIAEQARRREMPIEALRDEAAAIFAEPMFLVLLEGSRLEIFRRYKNGNLHRHPDVRFDFVPREMAYVWDDEAMDHGRASRVERDNRRPWRVNGYGYSDRARAIDAFREACEKLRGDHG